MRAGSLAAAAFALPEASEASAHLERAFAAKAFDWNTGIDRAQSETVPADRRRHQVERGGAPVNVTLPIAFDRALNGNGAAALPA